MKVFFCILIGYLVGSLNPAALISRLKHTSLRDHGTGNLGATNTLLVFGKKLGGFVMLFDVCKGFAVVRIAALLTPGMEWPAIAAGLAAVMGHCFPFYLKFKGGKGLAAFGGMVLAYHPWLFLFILTTGVLLAILVNYSFILPYYASVFFAVFVCVTSNSIPLCLFSVAASALILIMHFSNVLKAVRGQEIKVRSYIQSKIFRK